MVVEHSSPTRHPLICAWMEENTTVTNESLLNAVDSGSITEQTYYRRRLNLLSLSCEKNAPDLVKELIDRGWNVEASSKVCINFCAEQLYTVWLILFFLKGICSANPYCCSQRIQAHYRFTITSFCKSKCSR